MIPFRSQCFICLLAHLRRCTTKNNNITRVKDNKQALPPCIRQGRPEALHSFYASLCIRKCNNQKKSGQQRIKRKIDKKNRQQKRRATKACACRQQQKGQREFFGQTTGSQKKTKKQKRRATAATTTTRQQQQQFRSEPRGREATALVHEKRPPALIEEPAGRSLSS